MHGAEKMMHKAKNIGLVAHDARKADLLDWVRCNAAKLGRHNLICTGTTGGLVAAMFEREFPECGPRITILKSGPLGGDQQLGARIAEEGLDILIFLTDPMSPQPHDVDVKALVRICTVYNVVIACTRSTADFVISSRLFDEPYKPATFDYKAYLQRETAG